MENFKAALKQKYTDRRKKMSNGDKMVERMKAKVRAKLRKKHGGSIDERLAAARKRRMAKEAAAGMGKGAKKVEARKAKIRELIRKRNSGK